MKRELAHLGYVVRDMASALRRFELEGAIVLIPPTSDPLQRVEVCLLNVDETIAIELVAPMDDGESPIRARVGRGGGLDHVCYTVDDVGEALAEEESKGAIVVCPPTYAIAFDREVGFVHRRSGVVVEYMSGSPPGRDS
ncbi:MAG: VOC family protein [Myxococcota bacterium]